MDEPTEEPLPMLDEMVPISRIARVLETDASTLTRRAQAGRFPAQKVGPIWITTLRQVVEAERAQEGKGKRGPSRRPLPDRVYRLFDAETRPAS